MGAQVIPQALLGGGLIGAQGFSFI